MWSLPSYRPLPSSWSSLFDRKLCKIWFVCAHVQDCRVFIESPPKTGKGKFLALKARGHIETLR